MLDVGRRHPMNAAFELINDVPVFVLDRNAPDLAYAASNRVKAPVVGPGIIAFEAETLLTIDEDVKGD
ncbi:hypothetical protein [Paraburkholderia hospita]|uniref:hypothetical protein n=1 Tax=Paraburkholderia hospita TaxID=169430 RepID=UPI000B341611|nr:hypothetical protein [Paraburkholderia hospita]OUL97149.1 hypothetical protein CA601_00745 [Paraburkholderia hospita]